MVCRILMSRWSCWASNTVLRLSKSRLTQASIKNGFTGSFSRFPAFVILILLSYLLLTFYYTVIILVINSSVFVYNVLLPGRPSLLVIRGFPSRTASLGAPPLLQAAYRHGAEAQLALHTGLLDLDAMCSAISYACVPKNVRISMCVCVSLSLSLSLALHTYIYVCIL